MSGARARAAGARTQGVTMAGAHRDSPEECGGNKPMTRKRRELRSLREAQSVRPTHAIFWPAVALGAPGPPNADFEMT